MYYAGGFACASCSLVTIMALAITEQATSRSFASSGSGGAFEWT